MSSAPGQSALEPGQIVGRYKVIRLLGKGAMGEVFLARDEQLGRSAAIKLLGKKHADNETVRERFLREARALAALTHPNLITIYEAGHLEGTKAPYFVMELLEGGDTQQLMQERGPLASGVVAYIGAQAAAGLAEAARRNVIHRDVKPSNLGITSRGVLKVTDFSLAKMFAAEKSLTGRGMVVGTADYIAPEQARGDKIDWRADLYALGCTLFHLLTGRPPFRADKGTAVKQYVEVMRAHLTLPVPDPRKYVKGVDDELAGVIMHMMDKKKESRPSFDEAAPQLAQISMRLGGQLPRNTQTLPTATEAGTVAALAKQAELTNPPREPTIVQGGISTSKLVLLLGVGLVIGIAMATVVFKFVLK